MSRTSTSIGIGLSAVASLGLAAYMTGRRAVPGWSGRVTLPVLDAPAEVLRDRWGVPSVYAKSAADAYRVQGWLHGTDRTFQLDVLRRVGTGRLAELVGAAGVGSDKLVRTLGFREQIDGDWEQLDDDTRAALEAFAEGVQAAFARARTRVPAEYRLLRARPAAWQAKDSLALSRVMALGLCGNWESELARGEIAAAVGTDVLDVIDPGAAHAQTWQAQLHEEVLGALSGAVRDATANFGGPGGIGSNNWVIGPRRTRDGGAILANDPHLDLTLPSVWYEQRLQGGDLDVRGFTFPGVPGVVLGHNGKISWGFTNSSIDVQDCYLEVLDEAGERYRDTDGAWHDLERRTERIKVKGGEAVTFEVRSTRRGPIITDIATQSTLGDPVSLRWDSLRPADAAGTIYQLNRATDWDSFRDSLRGWLAPAQNVVYADVDGNIGYQHMGEVPIRAEGNDGSVPRRGDDPAGDWIGTIPWDEQPSALNPSSGRIVTANDRLVGDDYPYFLSRDWMNGYRGERIRELIDGTESHTVGDQIRIQRDVHSIPGARLRELLRDRAITPDSASGRAVRDLLVEWDGELRADDDSSHAWRLTQRAIQDEAFGYLGDLMPRFLGYSRSGVNGFWHMFSRSTPRILDAITDDDRALLDAGARVERDRSDGDRDVPAPLHGWRASKTWDELLVRALDRAGAWWDGSNDEGPRTNSRGLPGPDRRGYHRLRLQHPLGVIPGVARIANRGPFPVPGDPDTVWQTAQFNNPSNSHAMVGPSHRHVVDMADVDRSVAILCGGQSGHPASPHYADQIGMWRAGAMRPAPFTRPAIEDATRFRQVLEPR